MLRPSLFIAVLFAASTGAFAQDGNPSGIDFMLRPSQDSEGAFLGDPWAWTREEERALIDQPVGLPLAGPAEEDPVGPPLAGPAVADAPVLIARPRRLAEAEPFAAVGMRLGFFVIRPAIEIGVVATDNAAGTEDKVGAVGLVLAPDVSIRSEDERHEISADMIGEGVFYDREEFNSITGEARLAARYELTSRTALAAAAGYARFEEGFTDPDTPGGAIERPVVHEFDASLGAEQRFGRIALAPSLFVERSVHEDVPLSGGGVASREELNDTEYGVRVRTGYALASLTPFTEVAVGRRDMDQEVDDSGFERSSVWGELRGGLVIDRGEKLSGELSLGYRHEDIEDDRLEDIDAFVANAALLWSPRRLTEIRFDLSTETQSTSVPDVSATILYSATATVARRLTSRVRAEAGAGVDHETPTSGEDWEDLTFRGFAGASYAFNRRASLVARYEYEQTESTQPDNDTSEHRVTLRVRFQR